MADVKDLLVRLSLDNQQLLKANKKMQKELKDSTKKVDGLTKGFSKLKLGFLAVAGVIGGKIVGGLVKVTKEAAKYKQAMSAARKQFGIDADAMVNKLREVSDGTISNADLIQSANKAMALNVTKDIGQMAKILEVARIRGQAMGLDTTTAFNDLVTGIGRGSPLILDNLGIITKGWAEEAKAAGVAMDSQFILNKVLADGAAILERTGGITTTSAEEFSKLGVIFKNIGNSVGTKLLVPFGKAIKAVNELFEEDKDLKVVTTDLITLNREFATVTNKLSSSTNTLTKKEKALLTIRKFSIEQKQAEGLNALITRYKELNGELDIFGKTNKDFIGTISASIDAERDLQEETASLIDTISDEITIRGKKDKLQREEIELLKEEGFIAEDLSAKSLTLGDAIKIVGDSYTKTGTKIATLEAKRADLNQENDDAISGAATLIKTNKIYGVQIKNSSIELYKEAKALKENTIEKEKNKKVTEGLIEAAVISSNSKGTAGEQVVRDWYKDAPLTEIKSFIQAGIDSNTINGEKRTEKDKKVIQKAVSFIGQILIVLAKYNKRMRTLKKKTVEIETVTIDDILKLQKEGELSGIQSVSAYIKDKANIIADAGAQELARKKKELQDIKDFFNKKNEIQKAADAQKLQDAKAFEQAVKDQAIEAAQVLNDALFTIAANNRQREFEAEAVFKQELFDLDAEIAARASAAKREKLEEDLAAAKESGDKEAVIDANLALKRHDLAIKADKEAREIKKKAWEADHKAAKLQAVINGAIAVTKTFASLGWPAGIPAAIGAGLATGTELAVINSQTPPKFADGGVIRGIAGGPRGEDGIIAAQNGESVLTRNATAVLGEDAINALNRGQNVGETNVVVNVADGKGAVEMLDDYFRTRGTSERGLSL